MRPYFINTLITTEKGEDLFIFILTTQVGPPTVRQYLRKEEIKRRTINLDRGTGVFSGSTVDL